MPWHMQQLSSCCSQNCGYIDAIRTDLAFYLFILKYMYQSVLSCVFIKSILEMFCVYVMADFTIENNTFFLIRRSIKEKEKMDTFVSHICAAWFSRGWVYVWWLTLYAVAARHTATAGHTLPRKHEHWRTGPSTSSLPRSHISHFLVLIQTDLAYFHPSI